jgi:hypothetical protein
MPVIFGPVAGESIPDEKSVAVSGRFRGIRLKSVLLLLGRREIQTRREMQT